MSLDTSSSALHLNLPAASNAQSRPPTQITVHPSVIATILTHHTRRPEESTAPRVIGTLMGSRSEDGQEIDVRSCFAVPHSESEDQIAVDMPFQQGMMDMLRKNGTNEGIIGWYATHSEINGHSALIQNYFISETAPFPAVHLTIDTDIKEDGTGLGVKGWISQQIGLHNKAENCVFLPIPVQIKYASSERAALDLLTSSQKNPSPAIPPLSSLSTSLTSLSELIDETLAYVQSVTSGEKEGDAEVGRYLLEGLGRWSATGSEDEGGVKAGLQDSLTVSFLANLLRSQIELSSRLTLLQQPAQ